MKRVGLVLPLRGTWLGGLNYFHNLLKCYRQYPDAALTLEVLTDSPEELAQYRSDAIRIHSCPEAKLLGMRRPQNWPRRLLNHVAGFDPVLLKRVQRHRIDLLSHNSLGGQTAVNTLFWQPDLQHKIFPHFFSARERARRDSSISDSRLWGHILFSSQATVNDFRRHYPELISVQAHVLRFSNAAALRVKPQSRHELNALYPTSEPYFFLPNQFWKHKNHEVVVEALHQTPANIRVICTGALEDPRDPAYVPGLLDRVKKAGLAERFICLGTVPYSALVSLMQHSIALLQPSLFEGWSTSVEESKAMGKQIILSNIDVHVEQAPERGLFFSPREPEDLAKLLTEVQANFNPVTEQSFEAQRPRYQTTLERDWIETFSRIMKIVSGSAPQSHGAFSSLP